MLIGEVMNANQRMNILNASVPYQMKPNPPEEDARIKAILKKLPEGFGPDHPQWNVPSFRNKWMMTQGVRFAQPRHITPNPVDKNPYRSTR